ncbi:hypothetical protein HDU98_007613 [Podochytrium sp. JEL0797]|nr:hypothetical protein HDU98_007613 [Podochytrium sp. JEL0797]
MSSADFGSTESLSRPPPTLHNAHLDDRPFRLLSDADCRQHPKAALLPQGIGLDLVQSILFGLVLTDPWNHPDRAFSDDLGGCYKFTTVAKDNDHRTSLKQADELIQALLLSASMYNAAGPMQYLTEHKAMHQFAQVLIRPPNADDEGYIIGLKPPSSPGASDGRAHVAFSGTKDWNHIRQALSFLPATINGLPTLSSLGCHSGYLEIAEKIPDIIGSLQSLGYNNIILCGHSRGGAIAHLVLLLYLYRNGTMDEVAEPPSRDSMDASINWDSRVPEIRSFAFASPFVVNEAVSLFLSDRGLHHRFLNVVNDGDVIPGAMSSLGGLSTQTITAVTGKAAGIDLDNIVRQIGPLIGAAGAAAGFPASTAFGVVVGGYLWNLFFHVVIQKPILTYKPIGRYIFLRKKYGSEEGKIAQYLKSPDSTSSLDAVIQHFHTIAKEFAAKPTLTVKDLHYHHTTAAYLHGLMSTYSLRPLHASFWKFSSGSIASSPTRVSPLTSMESKLNSPRNSASNSASNSRANTPVQTQFHYPLSPTGHEGTSSPELVFSALCPDIRDVSAQQVLGATPGAPRKVKLDLVGENLDFIDLNGEGILLVGFFVETVRFRTVVATTKQKMVVEAVVEGAVERLVGRSGVNGGASIVITPVFEGARPISRRITSMITIDSNSQNPDGVSSNAAQSSQLADGTIFDVCINAFKRSVINRSHELRAEALHFQPQPDVQNRLAAVLAAFAKLEDLCPPKVSRMPRAGSTSPTRRKEQVTSPTTAAPSTAPTPASTPLTQTPPAPSPVPPTPSARPTPQKKSSLIMSRSASERSGAPHSPPRRKIAELIEFLANLDAFPNGRAALLVDDGGMEDIPTPALEPTPEDQRKEKVQAMQVQVAMEEAISICSRFLEVLCSKIDITLEPSMSFIIGTGVVTGIVTALSIGLLIPEAPVIAAGIGMGFLTSTAVGPLGLGDKVIHAVHREQDNQYRFLLMELVKWIGVGKSQNLEFLNAHTHERAIEERLRAIGLGEEDVRVRKDVWTESSEGEGPLFSKELFGAGQVFGRATRSCLGMISKRVEMVRQIHCVRRLIVEETVVAFVGTQDAGKTTAARKLFGHVNKEFPKVWKGKAVRRGMYEHTSGVRVFPQGQIAVADFPGSDSTAMGLDQAMRRFGGVASVALLFCHFNGDASGEVLRNLEEIKEWSSRIPILLCIHQAGNKVNANQDDFMFNNELTCAADVDRFLNRWTRTVQSRFPGMLVESSSSLDLAAKMEESLTLSGTTTPPSPGLDRRMSSTSDINSALRNSSPYAGAGLTVAMTEFAKELDLCRDFGIWGVCEVRKWIRERVAESNSFIRMSDLLDVLPDSDE